MKIPLYWRTAIIILALGAVSNFQNCSAVSFSSASSTAHTLNQCTPNSQTFTQPNAQVTNKVDIMIVIHDTGSFSGTELQDASIGLGNFVSNLPANADYTIAFVPAINSVTDSKDSGLAYDVLAGSNINATAVAHALATPPADSTGLHGEFGMSSLTAALTTQVNANRAAGTLRSGAALAIFFMANEADICGELTPTPSDGIGPDMTDNDYSTGDNELAQAQKYCTSPAVNPLTTTTAIQNYANQNNIGYLVGGVVSTSKAVTTSGPELEYGWGYIQLLQSLNPNIIIPLTGGSAAIQSGIGAVGTLVGKLFNVKTDFLLPSVTIDPNSVVVTVNGVPLPSSDVSFNPSTNDVHIADPTTAGGPGASVLVNYCQQ